MGNSLAEILFGQNFGLFSSEHLESLYLVEIHIDDDFISKVLSKVLSQKGYFKNLRDLDFSHNILNNSY
jgi:hypothetical protein